METQLDKILDNEMETGVKDGLIHGFIGNQHQYLVPILLK